MQPHYNTNCKTKNIFRIPHGRLNATVSSSSVIIGLKFLNNLSLEIENGLSIQE